MDMFLKFFLGIVIIAGLVYFIIALRKKLITPRVVDAKGRQAVNYFIDFKHVDLPDLERDAAFLELATVKYKTGTGYCVASTVNDAKLKEFIKTNYQLEPSQFTVTTRQMLY